LFEKEYLAPRLLDDNKGSGLVSYSIDNIQPIGNKTDYNVLK
jgi:hypothetical protein